MRDGLDLFRSKSLKRLPTGQELLSLKPGDATAAFQRLSQPEQLAVIESTSDPRVREELYYLVPDGTDLVRSSRVESLVEIVSPYVGTGLACGILSVVTPEQFAQMFERTAVHDGAVDPETAEMWVAELTELEPEQLSGILTGLDLDLLAELLRGRVTLPGGGGRLMLDVGLLSLENIDFGGDEQAYMIADMLWMSDPEMFLDVMRILGDEQEDAEESAYAEEDATQRREKAHRNAERLSDLLYSSKPSK